MKKQPCEYCPAKAGKKHAITCTRPQKVTDAVKKMLATTASKLNFTFGSVLRNRIALVIDRSGSMQRFSRDVPRIIEEQVAEIKKNAAKMGQPTSLTIYTFDSTARLISHYEDVFTFTGFNGYHPNGQTAMFDGVGMSINDFLDHNSANDSNTSFLVITVTDGEENASRSFNQNTLKQLMDRVERTDRWTFVFSVPKGYARTISSFGIPNGNIQEWEQTSQGFESMNLGTVSGLGNYYTSRASGMTRSMNFFQPDLTVVPKTAIRSLTDLSRNFHVWDVTNSMPIREFVENKLVDQPALAKRIGRQYQIGRGYYQLTKAETVQASKDMVILDKTTNALYGGQEARELIGCPMNTAFKIKPGAHSHYSIFIKSTSVNRKLVAGTKILYSVN